MAIFPKDNAYLLFNDIWVVSLLFCRSSVFFLSGWNVMFSTTNSTSLLHDGQRGLLKIILLLMNMDKQLQPIISCYVTDLARSSVHAHPANKNKLNWRALLVTDWHVTRWTNSQLLNFRNYYVTRKLLLIWKTDVIESSRFLLWIKKYLRPHFEIA